MLKSDLVHVLVERRGITQKQAELAVETIFEAMRDALCQGENIEIRGYGAFHVKHYKGYQGRNPKTGEVIPVQPKRGILFRTGKELRERINSIYDDAGSGSGSGPGPSAGLDGVVDGAGRGGGEAGTAGAADDDEGGAVAAAGLGGDDL